MFPTLNTECSEFLKKSDGVPLLKDLPSEGEGFRKIKMRLQKNWNSPLSEAFNETFNEYKNLLNRSMFAYGPAAFEPCTESNMEPFFVFPINGFKFLYSDNVNSPIVFTDTLQTLKDHAGNSGIDTFKDVLKFQYSSENFSEALMSKSQIIIYDIHYYYAIRYSLIPRYSEFLF